MSARDWTPADAVHLPYGRVRDIQGRDIAGVRLGDEIVDLAAFLDGGVLANLFTAGRLEPFFEAGSQVWADVRGALLDAVGSGADERLEESLRPRAGVSELMPFEVADYVDFYASRHHASNIGRILRPDGAPLSANWEHMPIGYHGRAGTVVVSGTPIKRPSGQTKTADGSIEFGPSKRLDFEAEVGFVVGVGSSLGTGVAVDDFRSHVFGACLLNDWSARDIQAWEYVPLGPFLGKSFATSIAAWITPLDALDAAWVQPGARNQPLQSYLDDEGRRDALDLRLTVELNGTVVSSPPFASMYWTPAQMLTHMTVNGARLRTGDLYASGTVSGPNADQCGSLMELSWNGERSVLTGRGLRTFLADDDVVVMHATAPSPVGPVTLGEVSGQIVGH
ncbi:MAG TPA: fumarylacetoacetate hydrolase family protein [Acidothermaceae bacterium]|nr:fumarylacetoacetate hydrolase family protein [Acidothermaceae bacterium]